MSYKTSVAIAAAASLSSSIDLSRIVSDEGTVLKFPELIGIYIPSSWTAADITFQSSEDGVNWFDVTDAAKNAYKISVGAGTLITVDSNAFEAFGYLRIRSGTSDTPVNQAADANIVLKFRMDTTDLIAG